MDFPTRVHWRIQVWALEQGAVPAQVRRLKLDGEPATLTFLFGEAKAAIPDVYPISWDSFFAQFDLQELSMSFDDKAQEFAIVKEVEDAVWDRSN